MICNMIPVLHIKARKIPRSWLVLLLVMSGRTGPAQVVLDGKFGTSGALSGPNYDINASLGKTHGNNLFQSFSQFNLSAGETATFSGPANIQNILSRVTGGSASMIDGKIKSDIAGANFFFINPNGVIFGPNAVVDVSGSFAASSANYLKLADGARFVAALDADDSGLSTAPVSAFGFLGNSPAGVSVQQSTLQVQNGQTITLVGGDIAMDGGTVRSAEGQINIVSVQSAGEVPVNPDAMSLADFKSTFSQAGQIQLQNGAQLDASGEGGGRIVIRGGSLTVENDSKIVSDTTGVLDGRGIDVGVVSDLNLIAGGRITSGSPLGLGRGGDIDVQAGSVLLDGQGAAAEDGFPSTQISATTGLVFDGGGPGRGGDIKVQTDSLTMENNAQITSASFGEGNAGNIEITAGSIFMDTVDGFSFVQIVADTELFGGGGNAGNVTIKTGSLDVYNGALIKANANSGKAGAIDIDADTITLLDGSLITAFAAGAEGGGDIQVHANLLHVDGTDILTGGDDFLTGIQAVTTSLDSPTPGGRVQITADTIELDHTGSIFTTSYGIGAGGNIEVNAGNLTLDHNSTIQADGWDIGPAGNISVQSQKDIRLSGNSGITTSAFASSGGDINVTAGSEIRLKDSQITSAAGLDGGNITVNSPKLVYLLWSTFNAAADTTETGSGNGGNLTIDPSFLVLNKSSLISKSSFGNGGNISILTDYFFTSASLIDASAPFGLPGTVSVTAPEIDLSGSLIGLPANLLDEEDRLRPDCGVRLSGNISSFIVLGQGGLPIRPGGFIPSTAFPLNEAK